MVHYTHLDLIANNTADTKPISRAVQEVLDSISEVIPRTQSYLLIAYTWLVYHVVYKNTQ
jgi:hypothetical protein